MDVVTRGLPAEPIGLEALSFADLTDELQAQLGARVQRLGYLGAFFAYAGYQPAALGEFIDFTEALKSALPFKRAELVALTVARVMGNDYELDQHIRLCKVRCMPRDWIDELATPQSRLEGPALDDSERRLVDFIEASVERRGKVDPSMFAEIVAQEGASGAIGLLLMVSRFVAHATVSNVLGLQAPSLDSSSRSAEPVGDQGRGGR